MYLHILLFKQFKQTSALFVSVSNNANRSRQLPLSKNNLHLSKLNNSATNELDCSEPRPLEKNNFSYLRSLFVRQLPVPTLILFNSLLLFLKRFLCLTSFFLPLIMTHLLRWPSECQAFLSSCTKSLVGITASIALRTTFQTLMLYNSLSYGSLSHY